ncbi:uncharacterized protein LOC128033982 [Gossypium raimondii]|uniref:uncharacterized protein LOC128033982 n=1 Tax=Gossypium raimondii TaxID=29730 RepID=UPI00227A4D22|nr:uncharacterized protein LOC128033982 [Gossypium raimondii]
MYKDLCELYWWPSLKQEVTAFVSHCLACQKVKAEHQLSSGWVWGITKAASDQQKLYADLKRRDIKYYIGDQVFLKVFSWKNVLRFGHKSELNLRFIGPYRILKTYRTCGLSLELPPELDRIHNVFYVFILRRYQSDPSHIVPVEEIKVRPDLTFKEKPVQILDRDLKVLRRKTIPLVKVLWRNHGTEEATWEPENLVRQ